MHKTLAKTERTTMAHTPHQHAPQAPANPLPGVRNVIAVGAGKGGVGKSTAAALIAIGLQRAGNRVGVLDADIYGPSLPTLLGAADAKPRVDEQKQLLLPVEAKGLKMISIGLLVDPREAVVWRGPMVHNVLQQHFLRGADWGELDYLVVDLPPGTGDVPLTLSQSIPMTGSIVVCTPQDIALQDAVRAIRMYAMLNVPCLGIIENMSYYLCPKCGHRDEIFDSGGAEQAAGALEVPFLGALPLNGAIRQYCDAGTPEKAFTDTGDHVRSALEAIIAAVSREVDAHNASGPSAPTLSIE